MSRDCASLVLRQRLATQPIAATLVEEISMRTFRDQMRMQDGMHLVLDPRSMPDDLIATRHEPAHPLRGRIRRPDIWQIACGVQAGQRCGIGLVGLQVRMGDRFHLERIGNHHSLYMGRQNPGHRHAAAGRLNHTSSVFFNCLPNPSKAVRVMSIRPRPNGTKQAAASFFLLRSNCRW